MDLAQIRAELVGAMASVPNIGQVHSRERYVREQEKFKALYAYTPAGGSKQIRGWWLRRVATEERSLNTARVMNVHTWQWRGFMSFADDQDSEAEFDGLIELYRAVVRNHPVLSSVLAYGASRDATDGVQVIDASPVTFCGVLCHSAVLEQQTWSYLS